MASLSMYVHGEKDIERIEANLESDPAFWEIWVAAETFRDSALALEYLRECVAQEFMPWVWIRR